MEALVVPVRVAVDVRGAATPVTSRALTSLPALEAAMSEGLREQWRVLVEHDPRATLFQTAGWCVPWYRHFAGEFDPYVILITAPAGLVGLVPLAVERSTRTLSFASGTMADYRDIVALPAYREAVAAELVRHYLDGGFRGTLQIGWIDPASDTLDLVERICERRGLRYTVRRQPCWRWFPPAPARPSAQKFLNWYKRNGAVSFELIDSEDDWARFRSEYYRQHTLRQIQAGRQTAFDDDRKTALYDELFRSPEIHHHVTAFCHDGRMLAGHFGYVWRGVLLLGPPSVRLEDEQRSPAVILLSWIIQNAASLGLDGFDLTIGESEFKKRLGNQCVELSQIEIHSAAPNYYLTAARDIVVAATKATVGRLSGPDAWKNRIKPLEATIAFERSRLSELGIGGTIAHILRSVAHLFYDARVERTFAFTAASLAAAPIPARPAELHANCIEDLLRWRGTSVTTQRAMTMCARSYSKLRTAGETLHTLVVGDLLAAWCYSSAGELHDLFVLPEFRGSSAALHLIRGAAASRLAQGSPEVRFTVPVGERALKAAASACGRLVKQRSSPRLLGSDAAFDRVSRTWRRLTWRAIRHRLALAFKYNAEERVYRLSPDDAAELPASGDFARDRWDDLERFQPTEPRLSRDACLTDWRERLARGEHVYTKVEGGRLVAYGWVVERQKQMPLTWVRQTVDLPDDSAVLYDYYTLPEYRHRDFYQRLLMHAMHEAARIPGTAWVCLSILATDRVPRWWVERMGMECVGAYGYSRTLWVRKAWRS